MKRRLRICFLLAGVLALTACMGGMNKMTIVEVRGFEVQKVRMMGADALLHMELANGNKKKVIFERCRVNVLEGDKTLAVIDLLEEVELQEQSRAVVPLPVRIRMSGNLTKWGEVVRMGSDGNYKMEVDMTVRQEKQGKTKSSNIRFKRAVDPQLLRIFN